MVAWGWKVEMGINYEWAQGTYLEDSHVLKLDCGDGCTTE